MPDYLKGLQIGITGLGIASSLLSQPPGHLDLPEQWAEHQLQQMQQRVLDAQYQAEIQNRINASKTEQIYKP